MRTDYVPHSEGDIRRMLAAIDARSTDDLFFEVPQEVRLSRPLALTAGRSESEVAEELSRLAATDTPASSLASFMGAGVYDHYVPACVDAIVGRSEFTTAYTPYQPERSQGLLRAIFEFQTLVCELTGLDVANASMYDGGTALAEAAFLVTAETGRSELLVSPAVHPEYRQVLDTLTAGAGARTRLTALTDGAATCAAEAAALAGPETAAVVIQQPNFFGAFEDVAAFAHLAHSLGALLIVVADPLALGLLEAPGAFGADIVCGEAQAFGNPMNYGGPGLGFLAASKRLTRRMPGRLVGETRDIRGRRGYVLTLQTREQHIRRQRATSNICSNHALNALATTVYLGWLGREGLPELGDLCAKKAAYLRRILLDIPGVTAFTAGPVFREFTLRLPRPAAEVVDALVSRGFLAGVPVSRFAGSFGAPASLSTEDLLLVAVTERRTREQMDALAAALATELADAQVTHG